MKMHNNLNDIFDNNLDSNLEFAYSLSESEMMHDKIVELLKSGNVVEKQIAALKLDKVLSDVEAAVLLSNLTGCDGKIREAVAYKINKILLNDMASRKFFVSLSAAKIFADSTIDINANICRYTVDSAALLMDNPVFSNEYVSNIIEYTHEAFGEIDKFIYRDKKYIINKQIFKLYWCLEALFYFNKHVEKDVLIKIVNKAADFSEYTIREKAAKIVNLFDELAELKIKLANDENYYVRSVFN